MDFENISVLLSVAAGIVGIAPTIIEMFKKHHEERNNNTANEIPREELDKAIVDLRTAIRSSKYLPEKAKDEQISIVGQIADETHKSDPNKTLLKFLAQGMSATLQTIPDISRTVSAIISILGRITE